MDVYVDLYAGAKEQTVELNHWELQKTAGNLTAAPASEPVHVAGQTNVTANWTGLSTATRYLGQLHFSDGADGSGSTIVRVDT